MTTESEPVIEPPECTTCEREMEFMAGGTEKQGLIRGEEVEYQRFSCPECGQAARFERSDPDEDWSRAGA